MDINVSIKKRLSEMPESCQNNYRRAMSGKSKAAGIKAFCLECMGWDRAEVRRCETKTCPLFLYRPFRKSVKATGEAFQGI